MDKASVIAIRDALLQNGQNRAVRIAFDNGIILSESSDQVIWDDDKELVIGITADNEGGAYIAGLPIRIIGSTYENIQFIMGNTSVENLGSALDSIGAIAPINDKDKASLIEWYRKLYSHEYVLDRKHYDPIDIKRD